jgi:hypothetical protein
MIIRVRKRKKETRSSLCVNQSGHDFQGRNKYGTGSIVVENVGTHIV